MKKILLVLSLLLNSLVLADEAKLTAKQQAIMKELLERVDESIQAVRNMRRLKFFPISFDNDVRKNLFSAYNVYDAYDIARKGQPSILGSLLIVIPGGPEEQKAREIFEFKYDVAADEELKSKVPEEVIKRYDFAYKNVQKALAQLETCDDLARENVLKAIREVAAADPSVFDSIDILKEAISQRLSLSYEEDTKEVAECTALAEKYWEEASKEPEKS